MGSEDAGMWTQQQIIWIGWIRQIKSDPVIADQFIVQAIGNVLHQHVGLASSTSSPFKVRDKFFVFGHPIFARPSWHSQPRITITRFTRRQSKKIAPPEWGLSCLRAFVSRATILIRHNSTKHSLVRHYHSVDHVDHAVGLKYIGDCEHGDSAFFVFQFDVLAIMQHYPELAALYCG
jgi:hypothetical protein